MLCDQMFWAQALERVWIKGRLTWPEAHMIKFRNAGKSGRVYLALQLGLELAKEGG